MTSKRMRKNPLLPQSPEELQQWADAFRPTLPEVVDDLFNDGCEPDVAAIAHTEAVAVQALVKLVQYAHGNGMLRQVVEKIGFVLYAHGKTVERYQMLSEQKQRQIAAGAIFVFAESSYDDLVKNIWDQFY